MTAHTDESRLPMAPDLMAELRRSCAFFDLVALSRDAIVSTDDAGRIVLFNRAAEELLDYDAADVLGQPVELLVHPGLRAGVRAWLGQAPREAFVAYALADEERPARLRARGGRDVLAEVTLIRNRSAERHLFTAVIRDVSVITQDRKRERILAEAGEVFAASDDIGTTVRGVADVVVRHLGEWCLVYLTGEGEELARLEVVSRDPGHAPLAAALRARPLEREPWHPAREVVETGLALVQEHPSDVSFVLGPSQDGAERAHVLEARTYLVVPLAWAGRVRGALAVISSPDPVPYGAFHLAVAGELAARTALALEHAELHERAEVAARTRDALLRMVVHDLGTPLASASLATDRLLRVPSQEDRRQGRRLLESARHALTQVGRLVRDLSDIRSAAAGGLTLELRDLDMVPLMKRARDQVLLAADTLTEIHLEFRASRTSVYGDPGRLLQLLSNLLQNAMRFSPPEQPIGLVLEDDDDGLRVAVVDRGPGVDAAELPHLFDRLAHPKPPGEGRTGLGLTIARLIVQAHGGRIGVETGGDGSRFWFTLPRSTGQASHRLPGPSEGGAGT